jgi:hydrogenase maturation protease
MYSNAMISQPMRLETLIIGYGNPMRGDDGAGSTLAEKLADRLPPSEASNVKCISCMQMTPELADEIAAARRVIFVDASMDIKAGRVTIRRLAAKAPTSSFSHHLTPATMLYLCQKLYNAAPEAWVVAIGVESTQIGDVLSLLASRAVDRLAGHLAYRLIRQAQKTHAASSPPIPPMKGLDQKS